MGILPDPDSFDVLAIAVSMHHHGPMVIHFRAIGLALLQRLFPDGSGFVRDIDEMVHHVQVDRPPRFQSRSRLRLGQEGHGCRGDWYAHREGGSPHLGALVRGVAGVRPPVAAFSPSWVVVRSL